MQLPDFTATEHRPWSCPTTRWAWHQQWYDLAFLHWPIDAAQLRPLIPPALEVDTFDGTAWIGVVPFVMRIRRRGLPGVPTAYHFAELNVRTYVKQAGKPGVWFFSLDATSRLAVWGARWLFHLPYFHASIDVAREGHSIDYRSTRRESPAATFSARYRPTGPVFTAEPGTREQWLAERYALYCQSPGGIVHRGDIHHVAWPLQVAEAEVASNSLLAPHGLVPHDTPPLAHFVKSIDVVGWPLVEGGR